MSISESSVEARTWLKNFEEFLNALLGVASRFNSPKVHEVKYAFRVHMPLVLKIDVLAHRATLITTKGEHSGKEFLLYVAELAAQHNLSVPDTACVKLAAYSATLIDEWLAQFPKPGVV